MTVDLSVDSIVPTTSYHMGLATASQTICILPGKIMRWISFFARAISFFDRGGYIIPVSLFLYYFYIIIIYHFCIIISVSLSHIISLSFLYHYYISFLYHYFYIIPISLLYIISVSLFYIIPVSLFLYHSCIIISISFLYHSILWIYLEFDGINFKNMTFIWPNLHARGLIMSYYGLKCKQI